MCVKKKWNKYKKWDIKKMEVKLNMECILKSGWKKRLEIGKKLKRNYIRIRMMKVY